MNYTDKKFLDQDSSDDISVSDESDRGARKKATGSDDDDVRSDVSFDDDDPLKAKPAAREGAPRFVPRALELGSMKADDIEFEKWKSKVGSLDMNVREPLTLLRSSPAKQPSRSDSYEYNRLKDMKLTSGNAVSSSGAVADSKKATQEKHADDESADDSDSFDEEGSDASEESDIDDDAYLAGNKKKPHSRLMLAFKEIKQSVRSYSDAAKVIVELPVDVVGKPYRDTSENDEDGDEDPTQKNCSIS